MLYHLIFPLADTYGFANVFQYQTFRSGGAIMTALIISFLVGPKLIAWMRTKQGHGQPIREEGPQRHIIEKAGTPTMGGVLILTSLLLSVLLWARLDNVYVWIVIGITLAFGLLGFVDDFLKVTKQNTAGVSSTHKLLIQFVVAIAAGYCLARYLGFQETIEPKVVAGIGSSIAFPFLKDFFLPLGWLMVPFAAFVIVGASNTVNLTDGLDGLAIVPVMIAAGSFGMIAYLVGRVDFSLYLQVPFVPHAGELAIICGAIVGAGLGFLWFNAPPAMIFMGDTGSLSLGGAIGSIAVATKHEIVLAIIGGLFVLEGLSVMIQITSYKLFGKRVFKMAPIHHHFEQLGWHESTIVIRFWIIAVVLALIGLGTLKLR